MSCPGLPGCWSQGATEEEALANIRDAIGDYLAAAAESVHPHVLPRTLASTSNDLSS